MSTDTIVARYDGKSWTSFNIGDIFRVSPLTSLINSIAIDNQNTIWVATTEGILHLDGANWKIYTTADGLTDNDIAGLYQDKSGNIGLTDTVAAFTFLTALPGRYFCPMTIFLILLRTRTAISG